MATDESEDKMTTEQAWKEISKKRGSTINWYVFRLTKKGNLKFAQSGRDGLREFRAYFKDKEDEISFGLVKVKSTDTGGSAREKFIYVRFVGSKVSATRKARATTSMGKSDAAFQVKHLSYDLEESTVCNDDIFGPKKLVLDFLRVGGAHKPDAYDFGPDQRFAADAAKGLPADTGSSSSSRVKARAGSGGADDGKDAVEEPAAPAPAAAVEEEEAPAEEEAAVPAEEEEEAAPAEEEPAAAAAEEEEEEAAAGGGDDEE